MKQKHLKQFLMLFVLMAACLFTMGTTASAKGKYTVKASTVTINKKYKKAVGYNKKTKQYFMLRSYLEKLEKDGGGTLTLKRGTYNIPCTLYVPSNVTINLKKGVVLNKTLKTGNKKLKASKTMFELVPPSKAAAGKKVKKYNGSKNVTIKSKGKAKINLSYKKGTTAIVAGHNTNVKISGIKFTKSNGGSFVAAAAVNNLNINDCTFYKAKTVKANSGMYAIKLETPDSKTAEFAYPWSKTDKYANSVITITGNKFKSLNSAIGSVKYTEGVDQSGITIKNNSFISLKNNAIRALNWMSPVIQSNTFSNIADGAGSYVGILASGVDNPEFSYNSFDKIAIAIKFTPATNKGKGKTYATTFNNIDNAHKATLTTNSVTNAQIYYIPYQSSLNTNSVSRLGYFTDLMTKEYTISAGQTPYREHYTDNVWYNHYTKDYYVFRSYLEQLEKVGGGTLYVNAGTYSITNSLYVPSNTTIIFRDGTVINKGTNTGFPSNVLVPSQSVFQLVPPTMATKTESVGLYEGSHDVTFSGEGHVVMDMLYYYGATAIIMAHNNNVAVRGINFRNYLGHHFMEINSSQNVVVENNTFVGSKFTGDSDDHKEAINIDTPDSNTGGLNLAWVKHDRTPINNVIIKNNSFENVLRAIGSHKYSVSLYDGMTQVYHQGLQILNNTIKNTTSYAIRGINWKDCIIKGNTINNVNNGNTTAIYMSGAVNPTITENTIELAKLPITLNSTDNSDSKQPDKIYPKTNTILDSMEKTGKNVSDMLNNTLINMMTANEIRYYVGGKNKATSTKYLKYKFDSSKISYTIATPTPSPSAEPSATPSASAAPTDPSASASPAPSATVSPAETPAPSETPVPSQTPVPGEDGDTDI